MALEGVHTEDDPHIEMVFDLEIDLDVYLEIDRAVDTSAINAAKEEIGVNGDRLRN